METTVSRHGKAKEEKREVGTPVQISPCVPIDPCASHHYRDVAVERMPADAASVEGELTDKVCENRGWLSRFKVCCVEVCFVSPVSRNGQEKVTDGQKTRCRHCGTRTSTHLRHSLDGWMDG